MIQIIVVIGVCGLRTFEINSCKLGLVSYEQAFTVSLSQLNIILQQMYLAQEHIFCEHSFC